MSCLCSVVRCSVFVDVCCLLCVVLVFVVRCSVCVVVRCLLCVVWCALFGVRCCSLFVVR